VKDGDGMACGQQAADDVRADEAGAADEKNLHVASFVTFAGCRPSAGSD
jgi:hypothetical protein